MEAAAERFDVLVRGHGGIFSEDYLSKVSELQLGCLCTILVIENSLCGMHYEDGAQGTAVVAK